MRLLKYLFFTLLLIYVAGCSRVITHATYQDSELNGRKPAVLFVSQRFFGLSVDGKAVPRPFFAGQGGYAGYHIYLAPGEHIIAYNYNFGSSSYRNIQRKVLDAKENKYYKLIIGGDSFKFEESEMPNRL